MSAVRVHQFTASLSTRDAVSHHTLEVDTLLRQLGYETEIFAQHVHPDLRSRGRDYRDHDGLDADVLLYQASTGSPVADYLLGRNEPLVIDYHNLTPAALFEPWEPHISAELDFGRRQLARLARRASQGLADSRFNADELEAAGLDDVVVAPVLFEPPPLRPFTSAHVGEPPTLLFVGRLSPNKCQEDLISATAALRSWIPDVRLKLIGGTSSHRYEAALRDHAVRVCPGGVEFAGSVSETDLADAYAAADVFVCLSEHEGFCVPVIESMAAGTPVVAYAATVLPETIGDAGILLDDKSPTNVAVALERVLTDCELRAWLVEQGQARATTFSPESSRIRMRKALSAAIDRCV
ncbi:MAG: glycosyltransferase [Acidimicrobiales bacterium]|nr:glycosyltransferase [Acidimicrobiales bacterium]